ncbi:phosphatidylglycerophosphate phosphatase PTPMT2-like [Euphorbia lathyris]|uniref:phosphatidylglycerophosphate phosphatase PTPMT2-like n=1 Tax=Euphorbia lathyris TaxID=212925 RepID=UPI0033131C57
MLIQELKEGEVEAEVEGKSREEKFSSGSDGYSSSTISVLDAKRVLVGVGARALFYPTLLYNILRNKIQSEFRWWDRVDEFILLGAVPFPTDVPRLKDLGVAAVVTLNEPYETLVPTSLYHAYNIAHLVIPTRDYLYAPSLTDICQAVDFIHENASTGKTTYVHCKAGRGRSTTVLLCYLVQHRHMTPSDAYDYVRSIRPRVLLASSQWQAVEDYYLLKVKEIGTFGKSLNSSLTKEDTKENVAASDEDPFVVVTDSDLDGYDFDCESVVMDGEKRLGESSLVCRVQFASQAAVSRLSCLWLGYHSNPKSSREKLGSSVEEERLTSLNVDIQVH